MNKIAKDTILLYDNKTANHIPNIIDLWESKQSFYLEFANYTKYTVKSFNLEI